MDTDSDAQDTEPSEAEPEPDAAKSRADSEAEPPAKHQKAKAGRTTRRRAAKVCYNILEDITAPLLSDHVSALAVTPRLTEEGT